MTSHGTRQYDSGLVWIEPVHTVSVQDGTTPGVKALGPVHPRVSRARDERSCRGIEHVCKAVLRNTEHAATHMSVHRKVGHHDADGFKVPAIVGHLLEVPLVCARTRVERND